MEPTNQGYQVQQPQSLGKSITKKTKISELAQKIREKFGRTQNKPVIDPALITRKSPIIPERITYIEDRTTYIPERITYIEDRTTFI